mgnify:CR=1 FL=1
MTSDGELVQVIVMENGCMCCSVRGDILGAFASIFAAVEAGHRLDGVLIETTGMDQPSAACMADLLMTSDCVPHQVWTNPAQLGSEWTRTWTGLLDGP